MAKQNTAPTMKDVAKEAGVSLGTVSKVINGIPVGDEYRKKVEQAIKDAGLPPERLRASGLKKQPHQYRRRHPAHHLHIPIFGLMAHCINQLAGKRAATGCCSAIPTMTMTKEQEMMPHGRAEQGGRHHCPDL